MEVVMVVVALVGVAVAYIANREAFCNLYCVLVIIYYMNGEVL